VTSTSTDLARPVGPEGPDGPDGEGASIEPTDPTPPEPPGAPEEAFPRRPALQFRRWLTLIAVGGFAVRLFYLLGWKNTGATWSDSFYYHEGANLLADGRGYIHPFQWIYEGLNIPGADHPPAYLTVLSAFAVLGFRSFLAHQLISCVIGTLGVVAFGWAGRRVGGERVGLLTALILALSPNVFFHDALVMSESLVVATTAGVVWTAYRWWDRPGPAAALWFGVAVGVAALARSEALLLGPLIGIPLVWWTRHSRSPAQAAADAPADDRADELAEAADPAGTTGEAAPERGADFAPRSRAGSPLGQLALAGLAAAVVVAPWIVHNVLRFEHPVTLSAQFDHTLVSANCDEVYFGPNTGYWSRACVEAVEGETDPRDDASEEGIVYRRIAGDYVDEHQGRVPYVVLARIGRTFGLYQQGNQLDLDLLSDGKEKGLGEAGLLTWYVVAAAGAFGLVGLRRAGRPIFPLVAVVAATALTVVVTYGATRFRFPAELVLCIPAAVSLDAAITAFRAARRRRKAPDPAEAAAGGPAGLGSAAEPPPPADNGDDPTADPATEPEPAPEPVAVAGRASASINFAGLDGLRAVAALGVLVCHVALASGQITRTGGQYLARADVGVALFFMLSGFLLYRPFVSNRLDGKPRPRADRYLRHRFLRIFPAYWLALTVLTTVMDVRQRADIRTPWDFAMYYGLAQSYSEVTAVGGLQQAWTLTNELAFYLLLPLWALGAAWLFRRLRGRVGLAAEAVVLLAVAAGSLAFRAWIETISNPFDGHTFADRFVVDPRVHWITSNLYMFVPGMLLALAFEWSRRQERPLAVLELVRRHPLVCWGLAAVAYWYVSSELGLEPLRALNLSDAVFKELLYAAFGILVLAPVALAGDTLPRALRWLGSRVMVALGVLSYGIYLWHEGVTDIYRDTRDIQDPATGTYLLSGWFPAMLAFTVVGSVVLAAVSYWLVERPALLLKDRDRKLFAGWRPVRLPWDARLRPT
jgi:peptidoglycan/LPS O-acetylase OafA/YrhL/4-amino-4-deoxy-L-arabinose transferase-like glycosyltransferase